MVTTVNKTVTAANAFEMYRKIRRCNDLPDLAPFAELPEAQKTVWRSLLATLRFWASSELKQIFPYTEDVNGDSTNLGGAAVYENYARVLRSEGTPMRVWSELDDKIKTRWRRCAYNIRVQMHMQHSTHICSYFENEPAKVFGDPETP